MNKKGQIAIFIIIGVVIVAVAILIILIATDVINLPNIFTGGEFDFKDNLEACIEGENINMKISQIARQGGYMEPKDYFLYQGVKLAYLCKSSVDFETCYIQNPLLIQHVESEIEMEIKPNVQGCFEDAKEEAEKRGYNVESRGFDYSIDLAYGNLIVDIDTGLTISKEDDRRVFDGFEIRKESKLYELIMLSTSILNYEARYGDTDVDVYMLLYPEMRIQKLKQGDGTTLYFVSDRNIEEEFNFASKSLVFPPGYGLR